MRFWACSRGVGPGAGAGWTPATAAHLSRPGTWPEKLELSVTFYRNFYLLVRIGNGVFCSKLVETPLLARNPDMLCRVDRPRRDGKERSSCPSPNTVVCQREKGKINSHHSQPPKFKYIQKQLEGKSVVGARFENWERKNRLIIFTRIVPTSSLWIQLNI